MCGLLVWAAARPACAQKLLNPFWPEQRRIEVRDPSELPETPIQAPNPPPTVSNPPADRPPRYLSLDQAIRIALQNSEVVRVLAGVTATASGRTIYDAAITNTDIDDAQGRFDPAVQATDSFNRLDSPQASLDPLDPTRAVIDGVTTDQFTSTFGLSKTTATGGTASLSLNLDRSDSRTDLLPLNPQTRSSLDLRFTQPLLQGGGRRANLAPIVLARIGTERSYFQFKDSVQELIRGVIAAYWSLVFARTDLWARQQQVEQGLEAYQRAQASLRAGFVDLADVAQARTALANFRANLIAAEANVLNQEQALRNILGLPPSEPARIIPTTPPADAALQFDWEEILRLAQQYRPDIIELKLILEADQQRLIQAQNQAKPQLDATALYRWNGLEGTMPNGQHLSSRAGQFTEWQLGINFSVPLGLRQARAALRRQELIIDRDRANLEQGLHNAAHLLALNLRNLDQYYEQYRAFHEARTAAQINLDRQLANYRRGRGILLNVLQAIADWGNAVSAESRALTQYNAELANLERQTGTILETHGVRFYEERYASVGPLFHDRFYPLALRPGPNEPKYPTEQKPAEEFFDLKSPILRKRKGRSAPAPKPARPKPPPQPTSSTTPPATAATSDGWRPAKNARQPDSSS